MRIRDSVVLVTGASAGIGRAVAIDLAGRGGRVALVARRKEALEEVASEIAARGGAALVAAGDVTDPRRLREIVARIERELGAVDVLVCCAGEHVWRPFEGIGEDEHRRMMDVNYWGTFHCIRAVLPGMRRRGRGAIVSVAAGSGKLPLGITSGYSASKAAVGALSESLRRELQGSGVAVSCLFPASVRTGFWDPAKVALDRLPPVVRWSPKLSPSAVARQVAWTIRCGFAQRTFPVFLGLSVRLDALWPRLGDLILSRWGLPAVLGVWALRRLLAG